MATDSVEKDAQVYAIAAGSVESDLPRLDIPESNAFEPNLQCSTLPGPVVFERDAPSKQNSSRLPFAIEPNKLDFSMATTVEPNE